MHTQVNYNPSSLKASGVQWQMISGIVEPRSGSRCLISANVAWPYGGLADCKRKGSFLPQFSPVDAAMSA